MQLKFKKQRYQADAAQAVVDVFCGQQNRGSIAYMRDLGNQGLVSLFDTTEGYGNARLELGESDLLNNIQKVQRAFQIEESSSLVKGPGAVSLDIEMETGTGKTYVYIKTMYELNRLYGWTKFIVVVPSIAIREGVAKSFEVTSQHFFEEYGKSIHFFVYNSSRLNEIDAYSQSPDINVMIINMQAFNASMKEGNPSKEARIMYSERDEFGSRRPIDVLAANRPIVIQDEPQKMGGGATQAGIKRFDPLFTLNYSATHKKKHNCIYVLDALDAFNQGLVKRIEVKGFEMKSVAGMDGYLYLQDILVYKDRGPEAVIEYTRLNTTGSIRKTASRFSQGDDIYPVSGELEAYREGFTVVEVVPDQNGHLGFVRFLNGTELYRGQIFGDTSERDIRRVQIRETIKSHLEKEESLFLRGIKCLSLFFIDKVAYYRVYDEDGETGLGEYGQIFEEEYETAVHEYLDGTHVLTPAYRSYLESIDSHATHKGYFSIDKRGLSIDSAVKRGSDESDDESAYELILRDKERLLSFDEPTRFIFSHSALREGWDNPNVFQICTLKHSDSETGKRQEVGRGLRLCVNQDGDRQDLGALGETESQQVNILTVIASESYLEFVKALQSDISSTLRERPKTVTEKLFTGVTLQVDESLSYTFTADDAKEIVRALIRHDLIDNNDNPTEKFREEGLSQLQDSDLSEHLDSMEKGICALIASVYDAHALDGLVANGLESKIRENPLNENFKKNEFQELWKRINSKHAYTVDFDDEELRNKSIKRIEKELVVGKANYVIKTGIQKEQQSREDLADFGGFTSIRRDEPHELTLSATTVTYDLLGEIARYAAITRRSAAAILQGLSPEKFDMFRYNPEEFIAKVGRAIIAEKATMVVDHITYHKLNETYDAEIFTERMPENMTRALKLNKSIQDYVFWDSEVEKEFAQDLDIAEEVVVYAKLPRSFQIPTPVGNYAPDWAIAFTSGVMRHIYFIAETKGSMDTLNLKEVESGKIACATKLFNEMSTEDIRYGMIHDYDDLLNVVNGTR